MAQSNPTYEASSAESATPGAAADVWQARLRPHIRNESTELVRLLSLFARPDVLSLALGLPATELLPSRAYAEAAAELLARGPSALQMGPSSAALRERIVWLMARRGVRCRPEQIFLTTGAQQALFLISQVFVAGGAEVAIDEVTYPGMLNVLGLAGARLHRLPVDLAHGTDVDALEAWLRAGGRPAFLYLIPDGHNPLGASLPGESRARIAELSRRYGVPVVEDAPYTFLQFDRGAPPTLCELAPENVIHIGTFSKIFGPALRTGWMVVPPSLVNLFSRVKDAIDTDSSPFAARVIARLLEDEGFVLRHIEGLGRAFRERGLRLGEALARFTPQCAWSSPSCGLFVWLRLPPGVEPKGLLELAIERERLAFLPGTMFGDGATARHGVRLSYGTAGLADIDEGAARLGRALSGYAAGARASS